MLHLWNKFVELVLALPKSITEPLSSSCEADQTKNWYEEQTQVGNAEQDHKYLEIKAKTKHFLE